MSHAAADGKDYRSFLSDQGTHSSTTASKPLPLTAGLREPGAKRQETSPLAELSPSPQQDPPVRPTDRPCSRSRAWLCAGCSDNSTPVGNRVESFGCSPDTSMELVPACPSGCEGASTQDSGTLTRKPPNRVLPGLSSWLSHRGAWGVSSFASTVK